MAQRLNVRMMIALGGMPAVVSHRRPVPRVRHGHEPVARGQEVGALRADYAGPTGVQTVLQVALGEAGVPPSGCGRRCRTTSRRRRRRRRSAPSSNGCVTSPVQVELTTLDGQIDEYLERVEQGLSERPDVAEVVRAIEAGSDELPSRRGAGVGDRAVPAGPGLTDVGRLRKHPDAGEPTDRGRDGPPAHRLEGVFPGSGTLNAVSGKFLSWRRR